MKRLDAKANILKILGVLALLLLQPALAQPYLAAGGFAKPALLGASTQVTDIAVATHDGVVYAYWDDGEGIVRRALSGPGQGQREPVVEDRYIRRIMATTVHGSAALAWVNRSNITGKSEHLVRWQGETRTVLETAAPRPFAVGAGRDGPVVLYTLHERGVDHLYLQPWGGEPVEIASSEQSIEKFDVIADKEGVYHVSWLEGLADPNAIGGGTSEWRAFYRRLSAGGEPGPKHDLGLALNQGIGDTTLVGLSDGRPYIMWHYTAGEEGPTGIAITTPGQEPRLLGPGNLGITIEGGYAYWAQGDSVRRRALGAGGAPGETENVLWSPVLIEQAAAATHEGELFVLWYGPTTGAIGADYAVYSSSTETPFRPGWRDHLAARMGWNPWNFWAALGGQAMVSLFIGLGAAMVFLPLFWLLSLTLGGVASGRAVALGILASAIGLTLLNLLANQRLAAQPASMSLLAWPLGLVLSLLLAAPAAYLLCRNANTENQMKVLLSASLNTFIAVSLLGFINFQTWMAAWTGMAG